ncbi:MAG: branched-chain amino acid ABC transporter permease [Rhizobiaceae bacterium]|nr:branched-chain amino acid ABC transporter permease [Rhizobiaceae bacterium]
MNWQSFIFSTLGTAGVYATIALGVVLVYRTNKVLPFHVGALAMLSAYVMSDFWTAQTQTASALLMALATVAVLCAGFGYVMHLLVDRFGARYGHFVGTVITIAATTFLGGVMSLFWQGDVRRISFVEGNVTLFGTQYPADGLLVIAVSAAIIVGVLLAMRVTSIGVQMQAVAANARLAQLRSIPVRTVLLIVWIGSSLLAAAGGIFMATLSSVSLEGSAIGVSAIVAAVIGGLYSMPGAVIGAILLAVGESVVTQFANPRYSQVVPILMLVVLLAIRPSGLSGSAERIGRV